MEKRRVVIVGCGGITGAWMSAIERFSDVDIVGLCDLDESRIDAFRERWKVSPAASGGELEKVIRDAKADTVFDCTVPAAHHAVTTTALRLGCDVLGEKPMAPTLDEAVSMVAAARAAGKVYAVIQNRRYNASIVRYRRTIEHAAVGSLTALDVDFFIGAHFDGFRTEMKHVLLVDMAIHTFDQARFLSGCDAQWVYASDWNPAGSWYADGAAATCFFEMDHGLRFTYRGSWCSEGMHTSWEGRWRAIGESGTLTWDGGTEVAGERDAGGTGLIHDTAPIEPLPEQPLPESGHGGVIREFLDSLRTGKPPMTVCTDNINSVAMVLAAVESAETGARVKVRKEQA